MNAREAIQALQQFDRLDDDQVKEIVECIEGLICCGNCIQFSTYCGEGKCYVDIPEGPVYRSDARAKPADGSEKCDEWESVK